MDKLLPKKIWLAGLGALSRAEHEGEEWLSSLMQEGERYEKEKKDELDEALTQMTDRLKDNHHRVKEKFTNIESSFENKVKDALSRIGLVSKSELTVLKERLEALESQLPPESDDKDS